jgi:DNA-binding SARP family transcriptional activator
VFVGEQLLPAATWGSARPRELLLYLLLHPEGRTKEQVGLAFWPDASPAQLRNSFHVTLHRLRRALGGADWVTLVNDRYRIAPGLIEEFDAQVFEQEVTAARVAMERQQADAVAQLEQALARFRGDLLDGEPVGEWYLEHRDHLQRLYVDALMALGARHLEEERHERAAEAFRRVLVREGVHEQALQELMRCHVALGERPQALRLYRQFADRLRVEFEAEPRVDTVRLFERLQRGDGA